MNTIQNIAADLARLENLYQHDFGLYKGKTGLAFAYFMLSHISGDKTYQMKGTSLLDELSENIGNIAGFDFENGLAGIGWAIEWLVQNKFFEANTDEVLAEMDDELYRSVVYSKSGELSLSKGAIGKAFYFYRRLKSQNLQTSRYRNICNQECLVFLIDEIFDSLLTEHNQISDDDTITMDDISQSLLFLASTESMKVNTEVVKRIICAISKFSEQYFSSAAFNDNPSIKGSLYLIYANYKAALYLKDKSFMARAEKASYTYYSSTPTTSLSGTFQQFIGLRLTHAFHCPLNTSIDIAVGSASDIFIILRLMTTLSGDLYNDWGEGWGL